MSKKEKETEISVSQEFLQISFIQCGIFELKEIQILMENLVIIPVLNQQILEV